MDGTHDRSYDAFYYAHSCGVPYERNEHWLGFFGAIGKRIVEEIHPGSVLDAGCAMGFLVEALRDLGIEAYGFDISDYAISQARSDIQPFCWVADLTTPLPRRYDLITCIEVLEHLKPDLVHDAVDNLAASTDTLLFSSTPYDNTEATHQNVQPPDYWVELFARHGLIHDVDFDGSFISPWTMCFRRTTQPVHRILRDYERRHWHLLKANADLRASNAELTARISAREGENKQLEGKLKDHEERIKALSQEHEILTAHIQEMDQQRDRAREMLSDRDQRLRSLESQIESLANTPQALKAEREERHRLQGRLAEIEMHVGWRLVTRVQRARVRVFPTGGRRGRAWKNLMSFLRVWMDQGFAIAIRKGFRRMDETARSPVTRDEYLDWIHDNEPNAKELLRQSAAAGDLEHRPLISLITPVYDPPPEVLQQTIDSVLAQTYDHWEWCVVDGGSTAGQVKDMLTRLAQREPRVHLRVLATNQGISGNSNAALEMAQGEFVSILDHDDLLAPNALFEVAVLLGSDQEIDLIYFDEDKVSGEGRLRNGPWFKPDWSPELLLSANYLMHSVIRLDLVLRVGGFDSGMDGAQDWDLAFRVVEMTDRIRHIPKVLYHWRQLPGSAAASLTAKPEAFHNQLRCVTAHLVRNGIREGRAVFQSPGFLRVLWPTSGSSVSIIIPTRDRVDLLARCLDSIGTTTYDHYDIVLVDTGSREDRTLRFYDRVSQNSRVRIVQYDAAFNYSAANNLGIAQARGDLLLFLNNDVEVLDPDWLEEMVRWAERPEIGAVGAKLLYPSGVIQHAGVVIGMEGHASHVFSGYLEKESGPFGSVDWYRDWMAVTGACLMTRRNVLEQVGDFDEGYSLVFSDVELCLRIRQSGYRVLYDPFVRIRHYEGQSRGGLIPPQDILRGYGQMRHLVEAGDTYFNPNLSYGSRKPSLFRPGEETRVQRLDNIARIAERAINSRGPATMESADRANVGPRRPESALFENAKMAAPETPDALPRSLGQARSEYKLTWNRLASTSDSARDYVAGFRDDEELDESGRHTVDILEEYVGISPSDAILEIGCGVGRVGRILSPRCKEWIGSDISGNMLRVARQRLREMGNVRLVELANVGLQEFADDTFDLVYCTVVFMHLLEWDRYRYVCEALRVLKPGGRCFFDNVDIASEWGWQVFQQSGAIAIDERPPHLSMVSSGDELRTYAEKAGFGHVVIHRWDKAWVGVTGFKPGMG